MAKYKFGTGIPTYNGIPMISGFPPVVGTAYFVDSNNGSDGNTGKDSSKPFETIDKAISSATEDNNDIIVLMPGHTENLSSNSIFQIDKSGLTIIGVGDGNRIPTFTTTVAAGTLNIDAANSKVTNVRLVANFTTGTTAAVDIAAAADGVTLDGIQFRDTAAAKEFLAHIKVATTVTDLLVKNCSFVTLAGSLTNSILFAGTSANVIIEDNYFFVDSSDDVIDHLTTASVNMVVRRNVIINADTDAAGYCVRYKSDGTGVVHDNRFAYNKVNAEIGVGAAAWWFENYASNTIAQSGLLDPTTAHAIP